MSSSQENNNVEAGGTILLQVLGMCLATLLVYWNKIDGPYVMNLIGFIIAARYQAPRLSKGAFPSLITGIRASIYPRGEKEGIS